MTPPTPPRSFVRSLYFRVLVGIVLGILTGALFPRFGQQLKPFGDAFIKLIRMVVAPVIFFSVVVGIASVGDSRKLGRVGLKAFVYFEAVTTLALLLGLAVANLVQPGRGMNVDVRTLDAKAVAQYAAQGAHLGIADFLLNIIPESYAGAFTSGEILQVLLLAILTGLALSALQQKVIPERRLLELAQSVSHLFFRLVTIVMEAAPIGAFGAMAFTIGRYGLATLLSLGKLLLCVYLTSFAFVAFVLGIICWLNGVSLWRLLVYLREELLIVLGTSSSEAALPGLLRKMEHLGCSRAVTGLVIPAGYSFNLDGTSIYLTIAALFIAQATNTHLTLGQQIFILLVLMLNSKGAAAVTGGGFITLAATLAALGSIPVAGITLLLGVDRFMSEMRALTNLVGNGVATIVVARWEGQFDASRAHAILHANPAQTGAELEPEGPVLPA
ncbi:MAG: dicarboxylate/amino acid:cation symporter [Acidobacteriaceae bacterium]